MVLASWLEETLEKRRQRQIKAAEDKVRVEERKAAQQAAQQLQQRWLDWNQRREAAAAVGEEFTEPPPGVDIGHEDPQQQ